MNTFLKNFDLKASIRAILRAMQNAMGDLHSSEPKQTKTKSSDSPSSKLEDIRFETLSVEDGLPNETILSALQDQQGFMWFATDSGLCRYDGNSFLNFHNDLKDTNSLSNNNVFSLLESSDGLLWVGTDPGGLNIYDPETGKFCLYSHDPNDPQSLVNDCVWSLMEAQDGDIWAGTRNGISRLNRRTGRFKNYIPAEGNPRAVASSIIYCIYQDRAGVIWVGTSGGLNRYDPESDDFTLYARAEDDPHSLSKNNVWAILEDRQGRLWVGTRGGGLNCFDRSTGKFTAYQHNPSDPTSLSDNRIWHLYEDSRGNFWITTENGGLNLFDRETGTFRTFMHDPNNPASLSNNDVYWMTEDRSGVLWITSRYGGVNKTYPALNRFGRLHNIPGKFNTLNSETVHSILADEDGTLWIGTFGGGINRFDAKTGKMTFYFNDSYNPESLSHNKVYDIYRDEKGFLWAVTSGGGLNRMDLHTGKFKAFKYTVEDPNVIGSSFLTNIAPAGDGRLWVGTLGYGLDLFNPATERMDREYFHEEGNLNSLSEDTIYDLVVDGDRRLWIATTRGGLDLFDPATGIFTHHLNEANNPNSISSNKVYTLYLDNENQHLWVGTSSGLNRLDLATQQWAVYTTADGLPSDNIVGIQPGRRGELWLGTNRGISHFNLNSGAFRNFDTHDGAQTQYSISSSDCGKDGMIYFGGSHGLTFFHPDRIDINPYLPPVALTDFQLFNQSVLPGSALLPKPIERTRHITLTHKQSVFTLKFSALSYQSSAKNLYQYKLEGFDRDWSPPRTKQEATYTNLPPGNYTFMVRASNNDGIWNLDNPNRLNITILPPWWQAWWFRMTAVISTVLLIVGWFQLRVHNIRVANRSLEKRVRKRTGELQTAQAQLQVNNEELKKQLDNITTLEKQVREMAVRDALTGLYNRHYLSERLEAAISRSRRKNETFALLLLDIDHFKNLNDTYGHQAGDLALKAVARIITEHIRQSDIAYRYGGEELLIILPETSISDAMHRAEQFRREIDALRLKHEGRVVRLTVSIGVAVYPAHGRTLDELLTMADKALYRAKSSGRNRALLSK